MEKSQINKRVRTKREKKMIRRVLRGGRGRMPSIFFIGLVAMECPFAAGLYLLGRYFKGSFGRHSSLYLETMPAIWESISSGLILLTNRLRGWPSRPMRNLVK